MRKAGTLLKVEVSKVDIFEWVDTRAGKDNGRWYVWEFTTGRSISYGERTKKEAVEIARLRLAEYGEQTVAKVIASQRKINSYPL